MVAISTMIPACRTNISIHSAPITRIDRMPSTMTTPMAWLATPPPVTRAAPAAPPPPPVASAENSVPSCCFIAFAALASSDPPPVKE
ncbi:hypothetical protein ACFZDG_34090 [Kitasatospora xanthocidica]|uniref:hypothetical protein n=1 Tax=Kitasatospora xanthocidica TaxID=83382 RepID=UPI0036E9973C